MAMLRQTSGPMDYFVFSKLSPGLLLMSSLECQEKVQIVMMFRLSYEDLRGSKHMVVLSL